MKRLLPLLLCVVLLCGCASKPAPSQQPNQPAAPPASQETDVISYQVESIPYDQKATADNGTLLVSFHYQRPALKVLVNGQSLETPSTASQQAAFDKAEVFSQEFEQWISEDSMAETVAMAKEHYSLNPDFFETSGMNYADEFTFESHQVGNLVSILGLYYSYLGGAHPNTAYSGWNFDLETGKFITLPELAEDPQAFTLAVVDMMEMQAMEHFRDPDYGLGENFALEDIYWSDYRDVMESWATSAAVNLDEDGMYISFSAYSLASYATGPQLFFIPYADLDSYWSDAGRAALGLNG